MPRIIAEFEMDVDYDLSPIGHIRRSVVANGHIVKICRDIDPSKIPKGVWFPPTEEYVSPDPLLRSLPRAWDANGRQRERFALVATETMWMRMGEMPDMLRSLGLEQNLNAAPLLQLASGEPVRYWEYTVDPALDVADQFSGVIDPAAIFLCDGTEFAGRLMYRDYPTCFVRRTMSRYFFCLFHQGYGPSSKEEWGDDSLVLARRPT